MSRSSLSAIDGLLLLLTLIWGSNFSVVKAAIAELPPHAFNTLRLLSASALFVLVMLARGQYRFERRDLGLLVVLAVSGHFFYQLCFLNGLARTSVANSALILGSGPVAVALLTAVTGYERITRWHWAGTGLSLMGLYLVVGRAAPESGATLTGDLLTVAAVVFWTIYTVLARPLLAKYSPLLVTGWTLVIGGLLYAPLGVGDLSALEWSGVSLGAWLGLGYSAVFAMCVAYLIWYTAVQRIGGARTSVYSNLVPVVAMVVAATWLGEGVGAMKMVGTAGIIAGVGITRIGTRAPVPAPPEE